MASPKVTLCLWKLDGLWIDLWIAIHSFNKPSQNTYYVPVFLLGFAITKWVTK